VEEGHHVKLLARASSSLRMLEGLPKDRAEVVLGDIQIGHTIYRALAGCDRMFHVAANFKMWDRDPSVILDASIVGTREVLGAARARGLRKIVVTSSTAAVGATREATVMDETFEFNRHDSETYMVAKWRAEQIALEMAADGMPIVVVNPSGVFGPGDYKPTPSGDLIVKYLSWSLPGGIPITGGGINVVDVDDVVRGHILAMEKGRIGERYILAGDNVTFEQVFTMLSEITGLPGGGARTTRGAAMLVGRLLETGARIFGGEPPVTYKLARDFVDHYVWVTSAKAERELGYTHRPTKKALARSIRWYVDNGYVSKRAAKRIRFDLRSAA
jgi:dihydroflavonol-4-reductase